MRRNSKLTICVIFAGAMAHAACGDDTSDTTTAGATNTTGTTGRSGDAMGGASGSSGTSTNGSNTSNGTSQNTGTAADGTTGTSRAAVRLNDAQIASVSMTANTGEVEQNMIGVTRAQSDDVRQFAEEMVNVHTEALQREMALATSMNITPADNPTSQMLKSNSDQMVAMLQSASDDDFDGIFLRGQVEAHQMTLRLIEDTLLPSAQAQQMKEELTLMRSTVMMHLDHVRGLVDDEE